MVCEVCLDKGQQYGKGLLGGKINRTEKVYWIKVNSMVKVAWKKGKQNEKVAVIKVDSMEKVASME
jgi:hypothetical protein